jgi:6-phosphogluconolactonase
MLFDSTEALISRAVDLITSLDKGSGQRFRLICTGGRTAKMLYSQLVSNYGIRESEWDIYLTDERCLPEHHADRNDCMLMDTLVHPLGVKDANFYRVPAELGPALGSIEYSKVLSMVPEFDLALLVLGEDGHIASIFRESPVGAGLAYGVSNAPKWPKERITMSAQCLRKARTIILIAAGESKREALQNLGISNSVARKALQGHDNIILMTDINTCSIARI